MSPAVCQEVPAPPSPAIANTSDSESLFLGGKVNFMCPPSMATATLASLQVLTCSEDSGAFGFLPQQVEPCTGKRNRLFISGKISLSLMTLIPALAVCF